MTRRLLVTVLACSLLTAACAGSGEAKRTSPRTSLPAADAPNAAVDQRLTADKMRMTDPCKVLAKIGLQKYGVTKDSQVVVPDDPSYCNVKLPGETETGNPNHIGVQLMTNANPDTKDLKDERIRGFPTNRWKNSIAYQCRQTVLTDSRAKVGLAVDAVEDGPVCDIAKEVAGKIIDLLRTNPPRRRPDSTAAQKPCDLLDNGTASKVLGIEVNGTHGTYGPYTCQWPGAGSGLLVNLNFGKPKAGPNAKTVDLGGGVQAVQQIGPVGFSGRDGCTMSWLHHRQDAKHDFNEMVQVGAFEDKQGQGGDLCFKAFQAGKVVAGKLPKG